MQPSPSHFELSNYNVQEYILHEYFFFCPILEKCSHFQVSNILPSWGRNCPDDSSICPFSSLGQERGCFGVGLEMFCVRTYPREGYEALVCKMHCVHIISSRRLPESGKFPGQKQTGVRTLCSNSVLNIFKRSNFKFSNFRKQNLIIMAPITCQWSLSAQQGQFFTGFLLCCCALYNTKHSKQCYIYPCH